ncbi:MAG: hypothetical protein AAGI88_21690 [Pseudomonadota bacterium]
MHVLRRYINLVLAQLPLELFDTPIDVFITELSDVDVVRNFLLLGMRT